MNIFTLIGRTFFYQTVSIVREIKAQYPDSQCTMLVAARSDTLNQLKSYNDLAYAQLDWLSEYEGKWLATPVDARKISYYEEKFGAQNLRAIVTADRELGIGFVSGGVYAESPLLKLTRDNDDARWRYVIGLLDYIYDVFKKNKPDVVFAYCIASALPFAMYLVCRDLGVVFAQPVASKIDNLYVIDNTHTQSLTLVKNTYQAALQNEAIVEDCLQKAESYVDKIRNRPQIPEYINLMKKESINQAKLKGMLRTFCIDAARWGAIILGLKGTKGVPRQRKGWAIMLENFSVFLESRKALKGKTFEDVDVNKMGPYIYYPLHVDPEASTMVLTNQLTDQLFIIETIAKNMPANTKLLVKEHIPSIGRRPKGYYKRIRNMPDVKLVSPFMDSFNLTRNSQMVFTITGSAAWEAMIIGKPAILMCNTHYTNVGEGLVLCEDVAKIAEAIELALILPKANDTKLKRYVASIYKEGVYFPEALWYNSELAADAEVSRQVVEKFKDLQSLSVRSLAKKAVQHAI